MKLYEVIQTKNPTYILGRSMRPIGVFVHSTGATNTELRRYVDAPALLGQNQYNNHWNKTTATKSMHGFIGHDIKKDIAVCHTLPYNIACWGAGGGSRGSFNRDPVGHLQFEICEDHAPRSGQPPTAAQTKYYHDVWKVAEDYCVYLCNMFGFTEKQVTSHYEAAALGYASNHGDPRHWMRLFGDSMDKFRMRIAARLGTAAPVEPTPVPVPDIPPITTMPMVSIRLTRDENLAFHSVSAGEIVQLTMENYLRGVVTAENGNYAPEAQAIAARTYAYKRTRNGNIIDDTTAYQAYRAGRSNDPAYARAYQGIENTRGQVLTYKGEIADTFYSHSNGGKTMASHERWSAVIPYLITQDDPWDLALSKGVKNGHGVGMSQTGARYAESIGKTHQEILAFYFPGCVISDDYGKSVVPVPVEPTPPPSVLYLAKIETRKSTGLYLWKDPQKSAYAYNKPIAKGELVGVMTLPVSGFVYARYNGEEGYVDNQYLRKVADIPAPTDPVNKTVQTKFGGGIGIWTTIYKSKRLVQIPDGTKVKILKHENDRWAYVEYLQYKGYADKNYLV